MVSLFCEATRRCLGLVIHLIRKFISYVSLHSFLTKPFFAGLSLWFFCLLYLYLVLACTIMMKLLIGSPKRNFYLINALGLDLSNRRLVLGIMERICQATRFTNNSRNMSLIYVTHHFDELIPSISHVLHLKDGRSVYNGQYTNSYDPNKYF